jgi:hypothetical protein
MRSRNTRMLTLRLDLNEDADIIAWLDSLPEGGRSQAVRDILRGGARQVARPFEPDISIENIRAMVAEELDRALAGRQIPVAEAPPPSQDIEAEQKYGGKLDRMLGGLQSRAQSG